MMLAPILYRSPNHQCGDVRARIEQKSKGDWLLQLFDLPGVDGLAACHGVPLKGKIVAHRAEGVDQEFARG